MGVVEVDEASVGSCVFAVVLAVRSLVTDPASAPVLDPDAVEAEPGPVGTNGDGPLDPEAEPEAAAAEAAEPEAAAAAAAAATGGAADPTPTDAPAAYDGPGGACVQPVRTSRASSAARRTEDRRVMTP
jgi:hypothetical protein